MDRLQPTIVRLLQKGLSKLRYAVARSGVYDDSTGRAVMAWKSSSNTARRSRVICRVAVSS